jgi:hypothetical protein
MLRSNEYLKRNYTLLYCYITTALLYFSDIEDISDEEFLALQSETVELCMKKSGHWPKTEGIYETPTAYDPLAVNMGQLTIFRFTLKCKCNENLLREEEDGYQRCGQFLPYEQQGWPSFMGINGDSKFNIKSIFHKFVKKAL